MKDCNGTKIYDEDIIRDREGTIGIVFWNRGKCAWNVISRHFIQSLGEEYKSADIKVLDEEEFPWAIKRTQPLSQVIDQVNSGAMT